MHQPPGTGPAASVARSEDGNCWCRGQVRRRDRLHVCAQPASKLRCLVQHGWRLPCVRTGFPEALVATDKGPFVAPADDPESPFRTSGACGDPSSGREQQERRPLANLHWLLCWPGPWPRPCAQIFSAAACAVRTARSRPCRWWSHWLKRALMAFHQKTGPGSRKFRAPASRHPSLPGRRVQTACHLPVMHLRLACRHPEGLSRSVLSCAASRWARAARHGLSLGKD